MMETFPHFSLPVTIETLNGRLKTVFQWRSEDRSNFQTQAKTDHSPNGVSKLMGSLEKRVIVELSKAGQSKSTPVLHQRLDDRGGAYRTQRPRDHQTSVKGNPVEHPHLSAAFNHQSFDYIEAIKLTALQSHLCEIPTSRWWTTPHSPLTVQSPSSLQNAADGANRRRVSQSLCQPLTLNCRGAELAEITILTQLVAKPQHPIFFKRIGATSFVGNRGVVGPVHFFQLKTLRSAYPSLNCGKAYLKATRYRSHRCAIPNRLYHRFSLGLFRSFLPMLLTPKNVFNHHTDINLLAST